MAKLIMSLDNAVIREVSLDKERVTIGRKRTTTFRSIIWR